MINVCRWYKAVDICERKKNASIFQGEVYFSPFFFLKHSERSLSLSKHVSAKIKSENAYTKPGQKSKKTLYANGSV